MSPNSDSNERMQIALSSEDESIEDHQNPTSTADHESSRDTAPEHEEAEEREDGFVMQGTK